MAISRLVADSLRRDSSATRRTFCVMGRVVLVATARPTRASPRARFSCKQESLIPNHLLSRSYLSIPFAMLRERSDRSIATSQ
jgi:hypothetical protein